MHSLTARAARFLRLSALLLLALGILARPMVEQIGGIHSIGHEAVAVPAEHGHDHGRSGHDHRHPDQTADPEHATGSHVLMHQADGGAASALRAQWGLVLAVQPAAIPPSTDALAPRRDVPATPFRPPIA